MFYGKLSAPTFFQPVSAFNQHQTAMAFPAQFRPPPLAEPTPVVQIVAREDVQWNRPMFKAPPLEVYPKLFDSSTLAEDLRRIGLGER